MDLFIRDLTQSGKLTIVEEPVNYILEMTEIADRLSKEPEGGKAILFKNTGSDFPVLMNALGSEDRIKLAFGGKSPDQLSQEVLTLFQALTGPSSGLLKQLAKLPRLATVRKWMPRKRKGKGICQEVVQKDPNLGTLPVLKCWPADGGPFVTLPLVHTVDPNTGIRNLGMYRMQVFNAQETGMHWHMHKTGARHYRAYKERGEKMPVAVALGGDPVYTYAATAPLPDGIDEYLLAGFIRNKPVRLVKCLTQEMWVPDDADVVIEGYVDPMEPLVTEGPFGDHTGFYSLADEYPVFHVTAITHRKGAIYPATIVGIPPMEDAWIAKATEEIFREPLRITMIPELVDFHLPVAGVAHNIGIFSIRNDYPGMGRKILSSVWGAGQMMFTKIGLVVNHDDDLRDYTKLLKSLSQRVRPIRDLVMMTGPLDVLDHASDQLAVGGKMGIDGTHKRSDMDAPDYHQLNQEIQSLRSSHSEILDVNIELAENDIWIGLIIIDKKAASTIRQMAQEVLYHPNLSKMKCWIFTDWKLQSLSWFETAWIVGSNTDPVRDAWVETLDNQENHPGVLFIDASIKTQTLDGFKRDWPNPVVMDQDTIEKVNKKWPQYKLGPFIDSPSNRYSPMMRGDQAVAEDIA